MRRWQDSTDTVIPWGAVVYDTEPFWSAANPTGLTIPAASPRSASRATLTGRSAAQAIATSGCTRTAACSSARGSKSDEGEAGVRSIGTPVVDVTLATTSSSSPARLPHRPRTSPTTSSPGSRSRSWSESPPGLTILHRGASMKASFPSSARSAPPGRCHGRPLERQSPRDAVAEVGAGLLCRAAMVDSPAVAQRAGNHRCRGLKRIANTAPLGRRATMSRMRSK